MSSKTVSIASLGGTITMTSDSASVGVRPTLSAADLIRSVPGIPRDIEISTETLATLPGASLTATDVFRTLAWADREARAGAVGVVVIQGTDTIEETAYLLDLFWPHETPLVITGAMRPPTEAGADGPANLVASISVARSPSARGRGVLVAMNDQVHAAARVRKARSSGPDAFRSPSFGPLGYVAESTVFFGNTTRRTAALGVPPRSFLPPVAIIATHLDDEGDLLRLAAASNFGGFVLDAFGVGHVSEALAAAVSTVASIPKPVVLATRTGAGPTFSSTYGFAGSESDLVRRGVVPAGWLDARKSRLLLAVLMALDSTIDQIGAEFRRRGTWSVAPHGG